MKCSDPFRLDQHSCSCMLDICEEGVSFLRVVIVGVRIQWPEPDGASVFRAAGSSILTHPLLVSSV